MEMEMDVHIEASRFAVRHRALLHWGVGLLAGVRVPIWPEILATLCIIGLLLTFHQVVLGAVAQGELRRQATATHAEATWRCNALRGQHASDTCLMQLNAAAVGDAGVESQTSQRARQSSAQEGSVASVTLLLNR